MARKRWVDIDSPVGMIPALLPAGVPAEFLPRMGPIPTVGQHNESIRAELAEGGQDATKTAARRG
jgi:itaconate CoA-transferase